jgi:hypothetical protein
MSMREAMIRSTVRGAFFLLLALASAPAARAQEPAAQPIPQPRAAHPPAPRKGKDVGQMPHVHPTSPKASKMLHMHHEGATGRLGAYPLMREASGTAWQPESSVHEGLLLPSGEWITMVHGWATAVWDDQGGPRGGDEKLFGASMLMGRSHGPIGPGTLGFSVMMSGEPWSIGKKGYPLLTQTGESADGVTPLIDRQHPHDLFMELATTFSVSPDPTSSLFVYAGLPGEPALGPPVFMHRFSGESFPDAPIGHHWLDSTHITYGVLTAGMTDGPWKAEGSLFRGREPDENRTDIEEPKLDSHSFRLSANPTPDLSLQGSYGRLHSPESLEPDVDVDRTTVSAILNTSRNGRQVQATIAWGRNHKRPGSNLDAFLMETTARSGRSTWLMRVEQVDKDELFPPGDPRAGTVYEVEKLSGGLAIDVWPRGPVAFAIGGLASLSRLPDELDVVYGKNPISGMAFLRAVLR